MNGTVARRLELTLFRADGEVTRLVAGTAAASHDAAHLTRLFPRKTCASLADDFDAGFGIEAAMLAAIATDPLAPAQDSFDAEGAAGSWPRSSTGSLRRGFGHASASSGSEPRAGHTPERAVAADPGGARHDACNARLAGAGRGAAWRRRWREVLPGRSGLLARPEPVEAVAEVLEGPPRIFRWRRVTHRATRAEGPERIAPEWWRRGERRTRDYYRVEDAEGAASVYRDGLYLRDTEGPSLVSAWGVRMSASYAGTRGCEHFEVSCAGHRMPTNWCWRRRRRACGDRRCRPQYAGGRRARRMRRRRKKACGCLSAGAARDDGRARGYRLSAGSGGLCTADGGSSTPGNRRAAKGQCHLMLGDVLAHGAGQCFIAMPPPVPGKDFAASFAQPRASLSRFGSGSVSRRSTAPTTSAVLFFSTAWRGRRAFRSSPPTTCFTTRRTANRWPMS